MAHESTTPDENRQESTVIHGELLFARLREAAASRARALKAAEFERQQAAHKRLVRRMLNCKEEKQSPDLRLIT